MRAVITRIKAKMRKISGLSMGRRGTKLPCCSRAPQDPHSSWGHKSHWKTSSSHNGNAQRGRGRHRVLMGLGLGWEVPLLCTALPFLATPPAPALAAVPAPSTARLPRPRWHWAFLALLPLGPFRIPPATGIWEASSSGEGSAAAVPRRGAQGMKPNTHRQLCTFMVAWGTSMVAWGTSILLLLCPLPSPSTTRASASS